MDDNNTNIDGLGKEIVDNKEENKKDNIEDNTKDNRSELQKFVDKPNIAEQQVGKDNTFSGNLEANQEKTFITPNDGIPKSNWESFKASFSNQNELTNFGRLEQKRRARDIETDIKYEDNELLNFLDGDPTYLETVKRAQVEGGAGFAREAAKLIVEDQKRNKTADKGAWYAQVLGFGFGSIGITSFGVGAGLSAAKTGVKAAVNSTKMGAKTADKVRNQLLRIDPSKKAQNVVEWSIAGAVDEAALGGLRLLGDETYNAKEYQADIIFGGAAGGLLKYGIDSVSPMFKGANNSKPKIELEAKAEEDLKIKEDKEFPKSTITKEEAEQKVNDPNIDKEVNNGQATLDDFMDMVEPDEVVKEPQMHIDDKIIAKEVVENDDNIAWTINDTVFKMDANDAPNMNNNWETIIPKPIKIEKPIVKTELIEEVIEEGREEVVQKEITESFKEPIKEKKVERKVVKFSDKPFKDYYNAKMKTMTKGTAQYKILQKVNTMFDNWDQKHNKYKKEILEFTQEVVDGIESNNSPKLKTLINTALGDNPEYKYRKDVIRTLVEGGTTWTDLDTLNTNYAFDFVETLEKQYEAKAKEAGGEGYLDVDDQILGQKLYEWEMTLKNMSEEGGSFGQDNQLLELFEELFEDEINDININSIDDFFEYLKPNDKVEDNNHIAEMYVNLAKMEGATDMQLINKHRKEVDTAINDSWFNVIKPNLKFISAKDTKVITKLYEEYNYMYNDVPTLKRYLDKYTEIVNEYNLRNENRAGKEQQIDMLANNVSTASSSHESLRDDLAALNTMTLFDTKNKRRLIQYARLTKWKMDQADNRVYKFVRGENRYRDISRSANDLKYEFLLHKKRSAEGSIFDKDGKLILKKHKLPKIHKDDQEKFREFVADNRDKNKSFKLKDKDFETGNLSTADLKEKLKYDKREENLKNAKKANLKRKQSKEVQSILGKKVKYLQNKIDELEEAELYAKTMNEMNDFDDTTPSLGSQLSDEQIAKYKANNPEMTEDEIRDLYVGEEVIAIRKELQETRESLGKVLNAINNFDNHWSEMSLEKWKRKNIEEDVEGFIDTWGGYMSPKERSDILRKETSIIHKFSNEEGASKEAIVPIINRELGRLEEGKKFSEKENVSGRKLMDDADPEHRVELDGQEDYYVEVEKQYESKGSLNTSNLFKTIQKSRYVGLDDDEGREGFIQMLHDITGRSKSNRDVIKHIEETVTEEIIGYKDKVIKRMEEEVVKIPPKINVRKIETVITKPNTPEDEYLNNLYVVNKAIQDNAEAYSDFITTTKTLEKDIDNIKYDIEIERNKLDTSSNKSSNKEAKKNIKKLEKELSNKQQELDNVDMEIDVPDNIDYYVDDVTNVEEAINGKEKFEKAMQDNQDAYELEMLHREEQIVNEVLDYDVSGSDTKNIQLSKSKNLLDKFGRVISRPFKSMADILRESNLQTVRWFGNKTTETAKGYGGRDKREVTAGLIHKRETTVSLSKVAEPYFIEVGNYAVSKGKALIGETAAQQAAGIDNKIVDQFNKEVISLINARNLGKIEPDVHESVLRFADNWKKYMDYNQNRLMELGLKGMTPDNVIKHYFPQLWKPSAFEKVIAKIGEDKLIQKIKQGYINVGRSDKKAEALAMDLVNHQKQQREFSYDESSLDPSNIDNRTKARNSIDYDVVLYDDVKLIDLLDTEVISVGHKYTNRLFGWASMSKVSNGAINGERDLIAYKNLVQKEAEELKINPTKELMYVQDTVDMLLGRPTRGGIGHDVRNIKDAATLTMMGGLGSAQLIESSNAMTRLLLNIGSDPKFIKKVFKEAGVDPDDKSIYKDISTITGINDSIEHLNRQSTHLDVDLKRELNNLRQATVELTDKLTGGSQAKAVASRLLGKVTGYNAIFKYQMRLAQTSYIMDIARHFNPNNTKGAKMSLDRMVDNGLVDINGKNDLLQKQFDKYAKFDSDGDLIELNLEKWDKEAQELIAYTTTREAYQIIQQALVGEMPAFMNKPLWQVALQFRTMPILAQSKQLQRALQLGDIEAVTSVVLNSIVAGMVRYSKFVLAGTLIAALSGEEVKMPDNETMHVQNYVSTFGIYPDMYDFILKGKGAYDSNDYTRMMQEVPALSLLKNYVDATGINKTDAQQVDGLINTVPLNNTLLGEALVAAYLRGIDMLGEKNPIGFNETTARKQSRKPWESLEYGKDPHDMLPNSIPSKPEASEEDVEKAIKTAEKVDNTQDLPIPETPKNKYKDLSAIMRRIKDLEGYREDPYLDDKGVVTVGVGQTGKYAKMSFEDTAKEFVDITRRLIDDYDNLPLYVRKELVQAAYRGDLGGSPKFVKLFNEGKYEEASKEFLDNNEYRTRKAKGNDGVVKRMEDVSKAVKKYSKEK